MLVKKYKSISSHPGIKKNDTASQNENSLYSKMQVWMSSTNNRITLIACLAIVCGARLLFWPTGWEIDDLASEFLGIGITILIVDKLVEKNSEEQEKRRLVARMASKNSSVAEEAIAELRVRGWLTDGSLRGINLANAKGLAGLDLSRANLPGANLMDADLSGTNLNRATLVDANFHNAIFSTDTKLQAARLDRAKFNGSSLDGANLSSAKLNGAHFTGVSLVGTDLHNAWLTNAILINVDLSEANMRWVQMQGAFLELVWFRCTEMGGINLENAEPYQTLPIDNSDTVSFESASFIDDHRTANLNIKNWNRVVYDSETKWPDGFTLPQEAREIPKRTKCRNETAFEQLLMEYLLIPRPPNS